jgi:hypothetical protein
MAIYTRPADIMRAQEARFRRMGVAMLDVHRELVRGGKRDAAEATGGAISTKDLKAMGHPFGRVGGQGSGTIGRGIQGDRKRFSGKGDKGQITTKGVVKPLPINKQTGKLRDSFFLNGPTGPNHVYDMGFAAPYATFVLSPSGTKRMIPRGYFEFIKRRHKARKAAAIKVARDIQKQP